MKQSKKAKSNSLFSPRFDKLWMILLPCLTICCCLAILAPHFSTLLEYVKVGAVATPVPEAEGVSAARATIDENAPSLLEREWDACAPDNRTVMLTVTSTQNDMSVVVRDETNSVVTGEIFDLVVTAPNGDELNYKTKTDGSCYIVELYPGEYTVRLKSTPGYTSQGAVRCSVRAKVEYVPIQNISQVINIVDATEISPDEIKSDIVPLEQAIVPEVIISQSETAALPELSYELQAVPVTDSLGNQVYSYTVNLGPNGYLLYRGTNQESDVLPVDENGDGTPEYGLRYEKDAAKTASLEPMLTSVEDATVEESPLEEASQPTEESGYYISVALFNIDNTPVELYAIDAVPLTEQADPDNSIGGWKKENGHTYYYSPDGQKEVGLKNIDGKLYYFNERGEKASSLGIDVSCFNGHINWNSVKAQGIDFAIMRVGGRGWSSGLVYEDTFIKEYMTGAKNAGIKVGVYFYSTAISTVEAVQEASVVLEKLSGTHLDYPVYIDMEFSGDYPNGRADTLGTAQRVDIANAFCKTITSSGYAAGIYASENYMATAMDYRSVSQYSYWLANYTENNALPTFSGRYDIWQFTNCGQVSGMSGTVDLNVIF